MRVTANICNVITKNINEAVQIVGMTGFDIENASQMKDPYDYCAFVKVVTSDNEMTVTFYYDNSEYPTDNEINWIRENVRNYVDGSAEVIKVNDIYTYVENGFGGRDYYA